VEGSRGGGYEFGSMREDTTLVIENLVFSVSKDKLLWAAVSETTNPKNAGALGTVKCASWCVNNPSKYEPRPDRGTSTANPTDGAPSRSTGVSRVSGRPGCRRR
jgi:hypothetical protein